MARRFCADSSSERDRRLDPAEERAIRSVLAEKKGRYEELVLFEMALESAMRLREIYALTWDQVDFVLRTMLRSFTPIKGVFKSTTLSIFQMHVVALRVHLARKPLSILSTVPASVSVTSVDTLSAAGADVRFASYGYFGFR